MRTFILLSLILWHPHLLASICLRTPSQPVESLPSHCRDSGKSLHQALLPRDTSEAMEKIRIQIEKNPGHADKLWMKFFESLKRRAWGPAERRIAEQIQWRTDQFSEWWESRGALPMREEASLHLLPAQGMEDLEVYRNGEWVTDRAWEVAGVSHWLVFSSAFQPRLYWGSGAELANQLQSWKPIPWLSEGCQVQRSLVKGSPPLELFGPACTARASSDPAPNNNNNINKSDAAWNVPTQGTRLASLPRSETKVSGAPSWWWFVAAAVLIPTAHHLSDKTLVIGTR